MKNRVSADELLDIFNNQWATTKDIMKIGAVGKNKALKIKTEISAAINNQQGLTLPRNLVPMEYVIDYFRINITYLKKVARKKED